MTDENENDMNTTTFQQPALDQAEVIDTSNSVRPVAESVRTAKTFETTKPVMTTNVGKNDELTRAVLNSQRPTFIAEPEKVQPPGKYVLEYDYNGERITETHRTVPLALASVRRLRMIGIAPATSVREAA